MATAPTVPNFSQYNFELGDRSAVVTKQNGLNAALAQFGNSLAVMTESINDDLTVMEQQKSATQQAAQAGSESAQQVSTDRQAVADDRAHVDQQKQAIDTTAGQVSSHAQQVATDKQAVADNTATATQAAQDAGAAAGASIQAKNDAQALYGDLAAVDAAKSAAQQAATTASEQRGLAVTAREGAESAQEAAETAAGQSQQAAAQAVTDHEAKTNPHSQYEQKAALKAAAYREVEGPDGAPLMARGSYGLGESQLPGMTGNLFGNVTGFYYPRPISTGGASDTPYDGNWQTVLFSRTSAFQAALAILQSGSTTDVQVGLLHDNVQRPWAKLYHNQNIVGIVSRAGGFPSGAIIERDSNSFGEWVKLADGTMICFLFNLTMTRITSELLAIAPTLPASFSGAHRVLVDVYFPSASAEYTGVSSLDLGGILFNTGQTPTNTLSTVSVKRIIGAEAFVVGDSVSGVHMKITGRWY